MLSNRSRLSLRSLNEEWVLKRGVRLQRAGLPLLLSEAGESGALDSGDGMEVPCRGEPSEFKSDGSSGRSCSCTAR